MSRIIIQNWAEAPRQEVADTAIPSSLPALATVRQVLARLCHYLQG